MKPLLIKIGTGVNMPDLIKVKDYSNNKDYLGHNSENIPVFVNSKLQNKEVKYIMANNEIQKLDDGNYEAIVRQVYNKDKENGKKITLVELDVKDQNDYQYVIFYREGYSEKAIENSNRKIERLCEDFKISIIEEMEGKEVTLCVKTDDNGFTNYYINERREFYDWGKELKHDGEAKFPCMIKKFYKTKKGNKYNFIVEADVDGTAVQEFVVIDLDGKYGMDAFNRILKRLGVTIDQADVDLNISDKKSQLLVKRVTKDGHVYWNKRIFFEKQEKEHYWR